VSGRGAIARLARHAGARCGPFRSMQQDGVLVEAEAERQHDASDVIFELKRRTGPHDAAAFRWHLAQADRRIPNVLDRP